MTTRKHVQKKKTLSGKPVLWLTYFYTYKHCLGNQVHLLHCTLIPGQKIKPSRNLQTWVSDPALPPTIWATLTRSCLLQASVSYYKVFSLLASVLLHLCILLSSAPRAVPGVYTTLQIYFFSFFVFKKHLFFWLCRVLVVACGIC